MNLEKLGLLVLLKNFQHIEDIKKHFSASIKELLLATSASLDLTNRITADSDFLKQFDSIDNTLQFINDVVKYSANHINDGNNETLPQKKEPAEVKQEIISSLMAAVDSEIESVSESSDENKRLKVDALMTVRSVFLRQFRQEQGIKDEVGADDEKERYCKTKIVGL